ncbi:hypothetical protein MMC31_007095, partial [Peltigera leucophlebia]|nr:hypothetical protein [Peltigera leucophlebia]
MPSLNKRDSPALGPIDLDMFNADSTAIGGQPQTAHINAANSSFLSSLPPNFTGVPTIASTTRQLPSEPQFGYHPSFGYYSLTQQRTAPPSHVPQVPPILTPLLPPQIQPVTFPSTHSTFLEAPPVANFFSASARAFPTPSSPIEWSPSPLPPQNPTSQSVPPNAETASNRNGRERQIGSSAQAMPAINEDRIPLQPKHITNVDERPKKRGRGREFKPRNKKQFWAMIRDLLKEQIGYDLKEPRNTVLRWVADIGDELVSEEMGSGTQVDQDNFKTAVEKFAQRIKAVGQELETQVKSQQAKAAELFESACVQSAMVFGLDDEPIPGVDAPSNSSIAAPRLSSSIALNLLARATANKRKREDSATPSANDVQTSRENDALANSFEKATNVLAKALQNRGLEPTTAATISALNDQILRMESWLTDVQSNMEARLGDVTGMLGKILAAVGEGQ